MANQLPKIKQIQAKPRDIQIFNLHLFLHPAHTGTSTSLHESPISTLDNQTDEDDLDSLVSMFPDKDRNHLRRVLNNNLSLQDAIDELLCSTQHSVPSLLGEVLFCKYFTVEPLLTDALV